MKFHSRWAATALFAIACLLSGCGGGGSSAAPAPTPTPTNIPFKLFPASYFTNGYTKTYQLSGSDTAGGTFTATLTETTQAQSIYNGQPAIPVQSVFNLTNATTSTFVTTTGIDYYSTDTNNLMYFGYTDSMGDVFNATLLNVIPQTAMIGASGGGFVGMYSGSGTAAGETDRVTWQLTDASNGFANLILTNNTYIGATIDSSERHTYVIDQQGNRQSLKIVISLYATDGVTVINTMTLHGN